MPLTNKLSSEASRRCVELQKPGPQCKYCEDQDLRTREDSMELKIHLTVWAAGLLALGQLANGQESSQSYTKLDQAKQLSAMTGRPLLAVAGEASS